MKLFIITYGNCVDDTTSVELALSSINLVDYVKKEGEFRGIRTREKHDGDAWKDFILSVRPAKITVDAWSEDDEKKGHDIISSIC